MNTYKNQLKFRIFGKAPRSLANDISNVMLLFVVVVFLVFINFSRVYTAISIKGPSMMPTFNNEYWDNPNKEDIAYYTKLEDHEYRRGDIVIANAGEKDIIKRIVGLPGEKVSIKLDENEQYYVYINDVKLEEDYIYSRADMVVEYESFVKLFGEEITIKEGELFLLGDNRGWSLDSTYYGCFSTEKILGRVDYKVNSNEIAFVSLFVQLFLPILHKS